MTGDEKNRRLFDMYCQHLPSLYQAVSHPTENRFSYPALIHISSDYENATYKLFVVGQNPGENCLENRPRAQHLRESPWDQSDESLHEHIGDIVQQLMEQYKEFNRRAYGKPFQNTALELNDMLNPGAGDNSFIWSNLVPVSYNKGNPETVKAVALCEAFPAVVHEIEIVRPEVVVFFTGWGLDPVLRVVFPGLELYSLADIRPELLCMVQHSLLPELSFRTYHARYLVQSKQKDKVLRDLVSQIRDPARRGLSPYLQLLPGTVDKYGRQLIESKGPYCVWRTPGGRAYHLCIYESKPIKIFYSMADAISAIPTCKSDVR